MIGRFFPLLSTLASRPWLLCLTLLSSQPAHAYLGGFEDPDGYNNDYALGSGPFGLGATNYNVNRYNAGEYGSANGGGPDGSITSIPRNTGLWKQLDTTGLFGNRYVIAHAITPDTHSFQGDSMLGLRNDTGAVDDLVMRYFMDDRDRNGEAYSDTLTNALTWSIRVCPDAIGNGTSTSPTFYWTFRDANLNAGLQVGWNANNRVIYRTSPTSLWTTTTFTLDSTNYDRLDFYFNTTNSTWYLNAFDQSAGTSRRLVTQGLLDPAMDQLGVIDWTLTPGQQKNFFDNSAFTVIPEPSSLLLLSTTALLSLRRRRPVTAPPICNLKSKI